MTLASLKDAALNSQVEKLRSVAANEAVLKKHLREQRRMNESRIELAEARHKKEVECEQLRFNEALESMRERLRSAQEDILWHEEFKERGLSFQK